MSLLISSVSLSGAHEKLSSDLGPRDPLQIYMQRQDDIERPLLSSGPAQNMKSGVLCYTYTLTSQHWPLSDSGEVTHEWRHTLKIYRPDRVDHKTALLFVSGGTRFLPLSPKNNPPSAALDFARMAAESHSIVVNLQDVPNQYLTFQDGVPRKEDSIVAYTWRRFLDNPDQGGSWPLHLPMAKAVVKAMDAVQGTAENQWHQEIKHFVVAGASKRGWATWLSALADERVSAIAPVVIDILDAKENIRQIYQRYGCTWPPAFRDYVREGITDRIDTAAFDRLMSIEDPLAYLQGEGSAYYRKRLSIPKYIISASGDDFFLPDASLHYLHRLPGETRLRVVPNQSHYINMKIVGDAILSWYRQILSQEERPNIQWAKSQNEREVIMTQKLPAKVTLWQAASANCDFRRNVGIVWQSMDIHTQCDANTCWYSVPALRPKKGCVAYFVEARFESKGSAPLLVTTPVRVEGV